MTRLLVLADSQIGSGKALADDRLADQEAVLDQIADLAHERDVDMVLHLGDVFETRHPGEEERLAFKRWVRKVTYTKGFIVPHPRLVAVAGNHDLSNTALASAVDLYDRCEFIRFPTVLDLGDCSLACLPWAPIHNLVAARDGREGVYEQAAEALVASARDLRARCPEGKPALLAAHWSISGVTLPGGLTSDQLGEVVIPQEGLLGFDTVLAGHLHVRGPFGPYAMYYAGSPYPNNFGESNDCGVWIWDSNYPMRENAQSMEFVPLASRRLVTIDVDLTTNLPETITVTADRLAVGARVIDETDVVIAAIPAGLADATVRLRYTATEEQHRRVDQPALKRAILHAGAHKVYSVEPTILRENRARAAGVDESLEPAAALDAWCVAQQVTDMQRQGLQGLLARWT